ncbi:MAG TPA: peptidase M61, partial [Armatimonadota bacterium]|nr:peptidase M61 [Armatimonadota bacterium]
MNVPILAPEPPPIVYPEDRPYPGLLTLDVDATDVARCVFQVRQTFPVASPGEMTLLYPKWLPGFHSPAAAIELFSGLELWAGGERLDWRRDLVEVHAFHVVIPEGVEALEARFQFLSPTSSAQGTVA